MSPLRCSTTFSGAGNVQFGFSLRLFNSSHIFFIDFSTPAFLVVDPQQFALMEIICCCLLPLLLRCCCCCYFGQHIKLISLAERAFTLSPCHKIYVYVVKFSSIFPVLWAPLLLHAFWFHCLSLRRTKVQVSPPLSLFLCLSKSLAQTTPGVSWQRVWQFAQATRRIRNMPQSGRK